MVCALLLLISVTAQAATHDWAWMKGSDSINQHGLYGTLGSPEPTNIPGARYDYVSWTDNSGNQWLFGGLAPSSGVARLNDLWKYDPATNRWAWMKGSNAANQTGVYGTLGTPDDANTPGGRSGSVSWVDRSGNLWLFGGYGYSASAVGSLNDLWKYDPVTNRWAWMKGSNATNQTSVYGTQETPEAINTPGARYRPVSWTDSSGNMWLFGGTGYAASGAGYLNDLWLYNPATNQWTWMKGSDATGQKGTYGIQGTPDTANTPGARNQSVSGMDSSGNLWLFGGLGFAASGSDGYLNDLWKFDTIAKQWTWMKGSDVGGQYGSYGTQGTPNMANSPGARFGSGSWTDGSGNLWLFGGFGSSASGSGHFNDLWKYNPTTDEWTWVKGSNVIDQNGVYGAQGTPESTNTPGGRFGSGSWTDGSGNLWLFGGFGSSASEPGYFNDLWKYNPETSQWAWMKGSDAINENGVYGNLGTPEPANMPGARYRSISWTDSLGNLWLFGGYGHAASGSGFLNDLWKFSTITNQWTWIKGSDAINQNGVYGIQVTPDEANTPGARNRSVSWTDSSGNLWLFGGLAYDVSVPVHLNDLWKYDPATNLWTWMKGSNAADQNGTYGIQGTPDLANTPGARENSVSWTDSSGNLWLFGGFGYDALGFAGFLNDLWKFDPESNRWTWMNGSNGTSQNGVYGTQGTPDLANTPGARSLSVSWTDSSGNLWLFGGFGNGASGSSSILNDLWKYDPTINQWAWMKGSNVSNQNGVYGTQGTPDPGNTPGARNRSVTWTDSSGAMWLFGGYGRSASGPSSTLNDLWKYDPAINQWAWMKGGDTINQHGVYSTLGVPDAANTPGAREDSVSWTDNSGNFWLFGGLGYGASGDIGSLNDLWKFYVNDSGIDWDQALLY